MHLVIKPLIQNIISVLWIVWGGNIAFNDEYKIINKLREIYRNNRIFGPLSESYGIILRKRINIILLLHSNFNADV